MKESWSLLSGAVEDAEGEGGGGEEGRQRHGGKERGKEGTAMLCTNIPTLTKRLGLATYGRTSEL